MTRTQAVCLAALATLVLGGVYLTRTGHAPAGQPKLMELKASSLSTLQAGFNRESGKLRVILLLSPTCPTCLEGASQWKMSSSAIRIVRSLSCCLGTYAVDRLEQAGTGPLQGSATAAFSNSGMPTIR